MGKPHTFSVNLDAAQLARVFDGLAKAGKLEAGSTLKGGIIASDGARIAYAPKPGNLVELQVIDKPWIAPASLVESKIREALQKSAAA